jgi:hypothetical protein
MGTVIPQPGPETAEKIQEWLNTETPDQPDDSPESDIEGKRAYIKAALDRGILTKEQLQEWRSTHNVQPKQPLTDAEVIALHTDVLYAEETGRWDPIPF